MPRAPWIVIMGKDFRVNVNSGILGYYESKKAAKAYIKEKGFDGIVEKWDWDLEEWVNADQRRDSNDR